MNIHPLAYVETGATLGKNVTIEPFAVVKKDVILEDNVTIKSHAYIDGCTTIGSGTVVYPSASIGTKTQALKFKGEKTFVTIGKNCEIREFVTINSSFEEGSCVTVGDNCLLMAYCHVAHHCIVGDSVIMANNVNLAGHVTVESNAVIGGMAAIHQFVRIGAHAMVGGMSRITHDIPPYTIGGGIPFKFGGLNIIGLKRRSFPLTTRKELAKAFRMIYREALPLAEALKKVEEQCEPLPEIVHWLKFCRTSKRGLMCLQGSTTDEQDLEKIEKEEEKAYAAI